VVRWPDGERLRCHVDHLGAEQLHRLQHLAAHGRVRPDLDQQSSPAPRWRFEPRSDHAYHLLSCLVTCSSAARRATRSSSGTPRTPRSGRRQDSMLKPRRLNSPGPWPADRACSPPARERVPVHLALPSLAVEVGPNSARLSPEVACVLLALHGRVVVTECDHLASASSSSNSGRMPRAVFT